MVLGHTVVEANDGALGPRPYIQHIRRQGMTDRQTDRQTDAHTIRPLYDDVPSCSAHCCYLFYVDL